MALCNILTVMDLINEQTRHAHLERNMELQTELSSSVIHMARKFVESVKAWVDMYLAPQGDT